MCGNLFGFGLKELRLVGPNVERHFVAQIPLPVMRAGKHRAVDQGFETGHGVINAITGYFCTIECGNAGPSLGQGDRRLDLDGAGEVARRVECHLFPLHIHHIGCDVNPAFAFAHRCGELEFGIDC